MIPKVIHYCWFGRNPLPKSAQKCIASWRKYLPDYEIKEWNEDNFDVNALPYTRDAYEAKKYAFVSDYARMEILYKHGGLYFDTDVEVIRPLGEILSRGAFMGCEIDGDDTRLPTVAAGLGLAVEPAHPVYKDVLDIYKTLDFWTPAHTVNTFAIVQIVTHVLKEHGLRSQREIQQVDGITIYPQWYFNPLQITPEGKKLAITSQTYTIHHFTASWMSPRQRFLQDTKYLMMRLLGGRNVRRLMSLLRMG